MGGAVDSVGSFVSNTTGINLKKPLDNFTAKGAMNILDPRKMWDRDLNTAKKYTGIGNLAVGGYNMLGKTLKGLGHTSSSGGFRDTVPNIDEQESAAAIERAQNFERLPRGRSATLLSDEETDAQANYSIARRRLMGR